MNNLLDFFFKEMASRFYITHYANKINVYMDILITTSLSDYTMPLDRNNSDGRTFSLKTHEVC